MENYYSISISKVAFVTCLVISILISFTIFSDFSAIGEVLIFWIITLYFYLNYKTTKYYYNDEKLIVETGILNKKQNIIPLYRIINITAQENLFGFGKIWIDDKGQTITLKNVHKSKIEMMKLIEKWESAKNKNIRQEVI